MRSMLLVLALMLTACLSMRGETIYFTAESALSGQLLIPDSIKIINNTRHIDTVIKGTDKQTGWNMPDYTSVGEINDAHGNSRLISNAIGKEVLFSVTLERNSCLQINVFDLFGHSVASYNKTLNKGCYNFNINTEVLDFGVYFLQVINEGNISVFKIIGGGSPKSSSLQIEQTGSGNYGIKGPEQISSDDSYDFICYLKHWNNDTIRDAHPKQGDTFNFRLETSGSWNYSSGILSISGLGFSAKHITHTEEHGGPIPDDTVTMHKDLAGIYVMRDCVPEKSEQDMEMYYNAHFLNCINHENTPDSATFCCERSDVAGYPGGNYTATATSQLISMSLDTAKGVITDLIFHQYINTYQYYYDYITDFRGDERTDIVITLSDIPYTLTNDGSMSCFLKGKDIASHLKIKYYYSNDNTDAAVRSVHTRYSDMKIDDIKDDAEIVINMKK